MRVLIIEPAGGLWGSERALLDLIDSAPHLKVAVCCPPDTPLVEELKQRAVTVFPWFVERLHEKPRWLRAQGALGILRASIAFSPDVVHINQSGAFRVTLPAVSLLKLPVVCHVRIFEDAAYLASRRPDPRQLNAIIAISKAVEDEIRQFPELNSIPVHRIYDAFSCAPQTLTPLRVHNRIACAGRITPIKGQSLLVEAMRLQALNSGVECLIFGEGEDSYMSELTKHSPENVRWCGFLPNVVDQLRTCRVLVCPSHREPLGRVVFEAWDAGAVPVVFRGAGGAAEAIACADGGLIYEEQTPEALALTLTKALELKDHECTRLVENGRAWLQSNCAPVSYGRAISEVFASVRP